MWFVYFVVEKMPQRKTKLPACLLIVVFLLAVAGGILLLVNEPPQFYPRDLLAGCQTIPFNKSDKEHDAVAKFELNENKVGEIIAWYKKNGFNLATDSSVTNGTGQDGISFSIYRENQVRVLVVCQWKDF